MGSLPDLTADLERLVKLAYPNCEALARGHVLPDDTICLCIQQGRPQLIQGALEMALELESCQLDSGWFHVHARAMAHQVYPDNQMYREDSQGQVQARSRLELTTTRLKTPIS